MIHLLVDKLALNGWNIKNSGQGYYWAENRELGKGLVLTELKDLAEVFAGSIPEQRQFPKSDVIIFCPEGLDSSDLRRRFPDNVQLWFWDMPTGHVFPYPPAKNDRLIRWLHQIAMGENFPLEEPEHSVKANMPIVTYILMSLNILVFILMTITGGSTREDILIRFGAKVNSLIQAGQVWRLITSMFIHIGWIHLAFNLYALWVIGPLAERVFGRGKFLLIYLLSGIGGALASFLFSTALSAGASGAIFGILGAMFFHSWQRHDLWGSGFRKNLLVVIIVNLLFGLWQPGIDNFAHVGGLVTGFFCSWIFKHTNT